MSTSASEVVLLGSGRSIIDLTGAERAYLNDHPATIGLNKFLLFHEKAGILPRYVNLTDCHYPSQRVYVELVRAAARVRPRPHFLVHRYYEALHRHLPLPGRRLFPLRQRVGLLRRHRYWFPWRLPEVDITSFYSRPIERRPFFWARSLDEELYYSRGSLTTTLNLVPLVFPAVRRIVLVGVDLRSERPFFAEELARRPDLRDSKNDSISAQHRRYGPVIPLDDLPPIQAALPRIVAQLNRDGIEVVNVNPASLFCVEGICPCGPLLAAG